MNRFRSYFPFLLGNAAVIAILAWVGTSQLGFWRLVAAGLLTLVLLNGTLIVSKKITVARGHVSRSEYPGTRQGGRASRTRLAGGIALAATGLLLIVMGGI